MAHETFIPAQSPIPPTVTVHDVNNKIGIILTRCDLLETHSRLGTRATADLQAIREAAEALAVLVHRGPGANKKESRQETESWTRG